VQEHHRQQPTDLGVIRKHLGQCASQPQRLCRELVAPASPR
jgi:hypothetical protein